MTIHLVGGGPALEAVETALADIDVSVQRGDVEGLTDALVGVVSAPTGASVFEAANNRASRWIAIEIGGIGGVPLESVQAAISGFGPESACYACLGRRVRAATSETAQTPTGSRSAVHLAGAIAGHELVGLLGGEDRLTGHVVEVPYDRHRVLPTPGCACGSPPARSLDRSSTNLDVEAALDRAERALDDRTGLITEVGELESFPAPYYLATIAPTDALSDGSAPEHTAGVAVDWNRALMKALGEALERYAAAMYRRSDLRMATPAELDAAVAPSAFVGGPAPEDPAAETNRRWVPGERLSDGTEAMLPAEAVYFPPPASNGFHTITTGLAAHTATGDALRAGLLEVIERDATMLAWYASGMPPAVAVDDPDFAALAQRAASVGLSVTPRLVTRDIDVPVISVAVHREEFPQVALGSAASLDATQAACAALEEALQNWMELRSAGPEEALDLDGAIGRYATGEAPVDAAIATDGTVQAERLSRRADDGTIPQGEAALETVLDAVASADLTPYATRLTSRDLDTIGIEVVRVLVPEAQPLGTGSPIFGERARTVPPALGETPRLDRVHHPYP